MKLVLPCPCGKELSLESVTFGEAERQLVAVWLVSHINCHTSQRQRQVTNTVYTHWGATGELLTLIAAGANGELRIAAPAPILVDGRRACER